MSAHRASSGLSPEPFRFTTAQLQDLRRLGLKREQITALEGRLYIPHVLTKVPPMARMQDIRDKANSLRDALRAARKELLSLLAKVGPANAEVKEMLSSAMRSAADRAVDDELKAAVEAIDVVLNAVPAADNPRFKRQTRVAGAANPIWVAWFDTALSSGWDVAHDYGRRTGSGSAPGVLPSLDRSYPFHVSSTPGTAFREVVDICYAAMRGQATGSAERAIKAYIKKGGKSRRPPFVGPPASARPLNVTFNSVSRDRRSPRI